jgi:hypothetical protein
VRLLSLLYLRDIFKYIGWKSAHGTACQSTAKLPYFGTTVFHFRFTSSYGPLLAALRRITSSRSSMRHFSPINLTSTLCLSLQFADGSHEQLIYTFWMRIEEPLFFDASHEIHDKLTTSSDLTNNQITTVYSGTFAAASAVVFVEN